MQNAKCRVSGLRRYYVWVWALPTRNFALCTMHFAFKLYFSAITDVSFIIICEYDAHIRFFKL